MPRHPSLPEESEKALLNHLSDKKESISKFKSVCDRRPEVFGEQGSDLRRQVQKRRTYLVANPDQLLYAVKGIQDKERPIPDEYPPSSSDLQFVSPSPSFVRVAEHSSRRKVEEQVFSPLSPPVPQNIMAHLDKKQTSVGATYQLYIEKYMNNPFGMLCIRGNEVQVEKNMVDKLTILKPIFDMDDFDLKLYKAALTKGGTGIVVTEPTIPGYLWKNPVKIQELIDFDQKSSCTKSELTYKFIRMDMKKNREHRTHEVIYYFPQDITCNNQHFNGSKKMGEKQELITEMFVFELEIGVDADKGNEPIFQYCPFLCWKMAINGEDKQVDDDEDGLRGATKALARLGIKVGEKSTKDAYSMEDE